MGYTGRIVVGLSFLLGSAAHAACSGSGVAYTCTTSTTAAEVQTTVNAASDGAVLTFDAGTYSSWGTSDIDFSMSKSVTLKCATIRGCTISAQNTIGMNGTCAGTSTKLYRISGFVFTGTNQERIWYWGPTACTLEKIRIDNNTFSGMTTEVTVMYFGENNTATDNYFYGSVDNNIVSGSGSLYFAQLYNFNSDNRPVHGPGTSQNLFFEDNTITITTINNDGVGWIDGWGGHGVVVRFNTSTNSRILMHGVTHDWGPRNFEVYHNNIIHDVGSSAMLENGFRSIHHQGSGTFMFFENVITPFVTPIDVDAIVTLHYGSWTTRDTGASARCDGTVGVDGNRTPIGTYYGYPCFNQPGRDWSDNLFPIYAWRNRTNASVFINLVCNDQGESNPNTCVHHVVANRDYYNAVSLNDQTSTTSPFNGTTGMGRGTFANRPTTCTTNSESADAGRGGVGYWATDRGRWNGKNKGAGVRDGQLYICSATNTWTLHYKPYPYPHPLRVQGGPATPVVN